jgi:excisionase family DNA binding protein
VTEDLQFLTTRQVAEELSVSRTVVVSLAREGKLPARRFNGRLIFERRMFERWIQAQYAKTRRWVLEHDHDGFHGDWKDWPIGR